MGEKIIVEAVMDEDSFVGKIHIPAEIPQGLVDFFIFPDDLFRYGPKMGLDKQTEKFLIAALRGRWAITASLNLPDIALKTGFHFSVMHDLVRGLLDKNYARLGDRLDLYRFWIAMLHVKGVIFDV